MGSYSDRSQIMPVTADRKARNMVLGLGPVLRYELITTARRGRYYLARVLYGFFLLALLLDRFYFWEMNHPGGGN